MVQTKRGLVLATCFLSGAAAIISIVSLFTQGWVYSEGKLKGQESGANSDLNYGLLGGTFSQRYGVLLSADISMTCSYSDNACAVLCAKDSDGRQKLLEQLYQGGTYNWSISECHHTTSVTSWLKNKEIELKYKLKDSHRIFINAFAYLFTMIFLIISAVVGLFSAGLSVWNTSSNPIEVYFSIFGLYIYNVIAFTSLLISILIWGIMFFSTLADDPCVIVTIVGQMNPTSISLGWSFWINLASLLLYAISVGMLYLRSYLISKEPQLKVEIEENTPAGILLF